MTIREKNLFWILVSVIAISLTSINIVQSITLAIEKADIEKKSVLTKGNIEKMKVILKNKEYEYITLIELIDSQKTTTRDIFALGEKVERAFSLADAHIIGYSIINDKEKQQIEYVATISASMIGKLLFTLDSEQSKITINNLSLLNDKGISYKMTIRLLYE